MSVPGVNIETQRFRQMERQLRAIRAENARRLPCPRCSLTILPETMKRHLRLVHPTHRAGSGSRPVATPLPDPAMPALRPAGVASHKPETVTP